MTLYSRSVILPTWQLRSKSSPTRGAAEILEALRGGEQSVGELVDRVAISQPGMSKHLKVLRDAGFVEVRVDAQRRNYRLRSEPLREIDEWISPYRQMWDERLDALERHLEVMKNDASSTARDSDR